MTKLTIKLLISTVWPKSGTIANFLINKRRIFLVSTLILEFPFNSANLVNSLEYRFVSTTFEALLLVKGICFSDANFNSSDSLKYTVLCRVRLYNCTRVLLLHF